MAITKCLLIGCGKMGGALLNQWQRSDRFEFTVLDPVLEALPGGGRLVRDSAAIQGECFDIVIIAVKPQIIDTVMPAYQASLAADGVLVSIAAGYSIERLKRFRFSKSYLSYRLRFLRDFPQPLLFHYF